MDSADQNRLRLRSCGILIEDGRILLIKIQSPVLNAPVWMPPGGEVEFGESLRPGVKREFNEETNLEITAGEICHVNELINPPFHAVECYFKVNRIAGSPRLGFDPERNNDQQLLQELCWFSINDIPHNSFAPKSLLPKIDHWDDDQSYSLFPDDD